MGKIWVLQHHPIESLAAIGDALEGAALAWQYVRTFRGEPVPRDMSNASALIVMGGPMGVYETDRYPNLRDEMKLIESALRDRKPVLGVCLGSQLLAAALGAKVVKGRAMELGWHRVMLTADGKTDGLFRGVADSFDAFHWHGDVFDLPRDAVALASSEQTPLQAFRYGDNAYGLLFHIEATEESVESMCREFAADLESAGVDGAKIIIDAADRIAKLTPIADAVFTRWANPILRSATKTSS
ncbi:MAG TPA: gamma-glutamyl-gamma-aminobutyrate hydrolase family protein [Candidatus Binataceae bacterium]|nr:gamma-glutamyl-gamma-aminobutyrate hydrolase family protein [Candidatus Binataceae bacterium]